MTVRFSYAPYQLQLRSEVITARGAIPSRVGILIALQAQDDIVGIGDAAPFAAFGTETIDELKISLAILESTISRIDFPNELTGIAQWFNQLNISPYIQPALCFALECAAGAIIATHANSRLEKLLNEHALFELAVNALIGAEAKDILVHAQTAINAGYNTIKLKVGVDSPISEAEIVRALRREYSQLKIRADANGVWTYEQTKMFCEGVRDCNLECIEDPLGHSHPLSLKMLAQDYAARFALDDSTRDDVWRRTRIDNKIFSHLILKPSVFGLQSRTRGLVAAARAAEMKIVTTSLFESSVGLSYAAVHAAAFGASDLAHGLSTAEMFANDVIEEMLIPQRGKIIVPDVRELPRMLRKEYRAALGLV